jgi:hypothetical protein
MRDPLPVKPLMPYCDWLALGPEKAAEYLAKRCGYNAEQQRKLRTILEVWGQEADPPKKGKI